MRLRLVALAAAVLLIAAACTGGDWDLPTAAGETVTSPAAPIEPGGLPGARGRIAVLDATGTLTAFDADGSGDPVVLDESDPETFVRQPAWSPDGGRIAWVRIGGGGTSATLMTTTPDGGRPTQTPIAAAPFYLSWDPTSSRIAYLGGSAAADIELGLIDVEAGTAAVPLDAGSPFYFSWNPSGRKLLVHVGTDRLDRLGIDGSLSSLLATPGTFSAPVWTADGRTFVYAAAAPGGGQRLVAHDVDAARRRTLTRFDGTITFVVSPDGRRVAFQVVRDRAVVVPLSVIDRRTGAIEVVAQAYAPAFFWSPTGAKLLSLVPEVTEERVWFRWGVWEDGSSFTTARFVPSLKFSREYLRFFEQYAQSLTLWSPDERAFVYAGQSESGKTGVWIQPASEDAEPVLVADGVFATWSPA